MSTTLWAETCRVAAGHVRPERQISDSLSQLSPARRVIALSCQNMTSPLGSSALQSAMWSSHLHSCDVVFLARRYGLEDPKNLAIPRLKASPRLYGQVSLGLRVPCSEAPLGRDVCRYGKCSYGHGARRTIDKSTDQTRSDELGTVSPAFSVTKKD